MSRAFTIIDACDDPDLFARWFKDRATWQAWFAFLAALFALPLSDEQRAIFAECTGRGAPPAAPVTEAWLVCGRRAGKSFILALIAVFLACFNDWSPFLGPGERGTIMVIARDRRQARVVFRYVRALLTRVPLLAQLVEREGRDAFDLSDGVTIEIATASFRSVRGYTLVAALLDEIAFFPTDDAAEPDYEIIDALRPGMATLPGAMLLCASSPYARRGALWDAHRKHFGRDGDAVLVWRAATRTMNPTVSQRVIDDAMERDPASAAAEYLAEFRSDIEGFVNREVVEACVAPGMYERPPQPGLRYAAFVDPSGGSGDSFSLAIAHRDRHADRVVLDCLREAKPPFSPEAVVDEFAGVLKSYAVTRVQGDRYGGEFPRELFRRRHISYDTATKPKSDLYRELLPLINSGRCELLDHQKLISQLTGLERRTARSGRDSIDHAPGAHDDVANACAGALLSAFSTHKRRLLRGAYGYGGGPVTWWDAQTGEEIDPATREPVARTRIRVVVVPETAAPAAKGP